MNTGDWILITNIVLTSSLTIYLQIKQKQDARKEYLDKKLLELQRIAFEHPYVEDDDYTYKWDNLKSQYIKKELSASNREKFLKYDGYTEILFNLLSETYAFYKPKNFLYSKSCKIQKTEKKMLEYIAFKPWIRRHLQCWKNPLFPHDNRDTYGDEICEIVNKWID